MPILFPSLFDFLWDPELNALRKEAKEWMESGCQMAPTEQWGDVLTLSEQGHQNIMALSKVAQDTKQALVKANNPPGRALTFQDRTKQMLRELAQVLSDDALAVGQLTQTYNVIRDWADNLEALKDAAKRRLCAMVEANGEVISDAGSKRTIVDGWVLEMRPTGGIWDNGKVRALLAGKKLDVQKWMVTKVEYATDETKLGVLVELGKLTADEVNACRKVRGMALQPPHMLAEEEDNDQ